MFEPGPTGQPQITDEGKTLCVEADVKPDDLLIRTYNDFSQQVGIEEVAKIRFTHYQQKRLSKFTF